MSDKLLLDAVFDNEEKWRNRVWLTQPIGGDKVVDYTWGEALDQARRMAAHLKSRGFEPGRKIGIVSKNCAHFFIAELAIWMAGHTTVALYPTVSTETARYVLNHSETKLLFLGKLDTWDELREAVPSEMPGIAFPLAPPTDYDKWDEITAATQPLEGRPGRAADDIALIIYTSGSTGQPKGVMHCFGNISSAVRGIVRSIRYVPGDRALSYLPLAHVFERAYTECVSMYGGGHVFFAESLGTFVRDLQRCTPTVFLSVPRLWLKFQQGVFQKLPAEKLDFLLKIPIVSGIIKKKVLTGLGLQEVRLAGSGSAPIPAELIAWYRRLGLNLLEGYAMSEDFAYSHLSTEEHNRPGYVGVPYSDVKVKLSEEGEILIDSPGKMVGYYKLPALTAECFTEDGYFRTGDRGERRPDGLLKITGRVKELFKISKGKYVAPAPLENLINNDSSVELSCVSGSGMPKAYAQVVLAEDLRNKVGDSGTKAKVQAGLESLLAHVNRQVEAHERLQFFVVVSDEWSIANGFLTPTMKIRRSAIEDASAGRVEGWYEAGERVVWA